MILWIILFLLVVGISFILAFRSMRDYQEIPQKLQEDYGLFLIRQIGNFNTEILDSIREHLLSEGLIISLERLFKGGKSALTIFGPRKILSHYAIELNLLELEDYALFCDSKDCLIWEMGVKNTNKPNLDSLNILSSLPELSNEDQFFWQVMLAGKKGDNASFLTQIRAVLYSKEPTKRKILEPLLQNLGSGKLTKIPKPFSTEQMMDFFRSRSLSLDSKGPILDSKGVMHLLKI